MTTEFAPIHLIDRDKSPLADADHDPEHIADALRNSPHFLGADGDAGGDNITIQTRGGIRYRLDLDYDRVADPLDGAVPTPAADIAAAADRVLTGTPSDTPTAPWPNSSTTLPRPGKGRTSRCASTPRPSHAT